MEEEETPPPEENLDLAEYQRSTVQFLMFLGAWSSYKRGDLAFDPEVGTGPFQIIPDESLTLP